MKEEINEVLEKYTELRYNEHANIMIGTVEAFSNDIYEVRIELESWNKGFPKVFETAERIPNHLDRHIFPEGNFCFTTTAKEEILLATEVRKLINFMDFILVPYLKNNSYYEINDNYRFGEYSHHAGIIEGYSEILKVQNNQVIINVLKSYTKGVRLNLNNICFCGSGKRLGKCSSRSHYKGYRKLRHISLETIKSDVTLLITEQISEKLKLYQMLLGM